MRRGSSVLIPGVHHLSFKSRISTSTCKFTVRKRDSNALAVVLASQHPTISTSISKTIIKEAEKSKATQLL
jgi:hypothetical protein